MYKVSSPQTALNRVLLILILNVIIVIRRYLGNEWETETQWLHIDSENQIYLTKGYVSAKIELCLF